MSQWLTIEELAKQEGISAESARKRAQRGQYERRKDGRRTLYRIFTAEQAEAAAEEKKEVSAQSAFLVAKAEKMKLDAERAKVKLHQEKMLLYDDVYRDDISACKLLCTLLANGAREILKPEQYDAFKKMTENALKTYRERFKELRDEYADQIKSNPEIFGEYVAYAHKKNAEEKAAEKEQKAKRESERKKRPIDLLRAEACNKVFNNEYLSKWYVEIKAKSNLTDKQTADLLDEYRERFDKLGAKCVLDAEKITNEAGLQDLITEYQAKLDKLTADTLKKGE